MGIRLHRTKAIASGAAFVSATALVMTAAPAASAATAVPTVTVHMSASAITFSGGGATTTDGATTLRAGRYRFHVVSKQGGHALQLVRFRNGYTPEQAQADFNDAFGGNVDAVQRIDNGVVFLGGASAGPKHPGDMVVRLRPAQLMALDQNGDAGALLQVTGTAPKKQARVAHTGTYAAYSFGWGHSRRLPASGMVKFKNQADQPHFLVIQRVKSSTTNAKVRRYLATGSQKNPPWVLKGSADSGVVSPGKSQLLTYDLPAGKYLVACFWPDYFTGMPHVAMGMWKLVTLS